MTSDSFLSRFQKSKASLSPSAQASLGECLSKIENWIASSRILDSEKEEILLLLESQEAVELRDRFYRELEFGTGGLRGLTGAGNNRMNPAVVRRATQGFANYINKAKIEPSRKKVAIAYDSRTRSKEFSTIAAQVLCANGIQVFLFDDYQTTPCLSFAVRELGCIGGLCVTASHNPPAYHGYKVYWADGAQITPPEDTGIITEVFALSGWDQDKTLPEEECRQKGLLQAVPPDVESKFFQILASLSLCTEKELNKEIKVVYTPLHGTGAAPTRHMLKALGYKNLTIVPEQEMPDGRFPTVKKPNPEEPAALKMAIDLSQKIGADICLATDPDSDRLALIVRDAQLSKGAFRSQAFGEYILLDGNQTGALLIDFLLERRKLQGTLKPNHAVVKTIVTSELHRLLCEAAGVRIFDTLTGFKWIGALIKEWEDQKSDNAFVFGTEESFGFMPGSYVRDKDGIGALCMAVEMAAYHNKLGTTPAQKLLGVFEKHGSWKEDLVSYDLEGEAGSQRIKTVMTHMRTKPAKTLNGKPVRFLRDYQVQKTHEFTNATGQPHTLEHTSPLSLPKSDVLQFELVDGSRVSLRPSGTEPKLKLYLSVCTKTLKGSEVDFLESQSRIESMREELKSLIERIP